MNAPEVPIAMPGSGEESTLIKRLLEGLDKAGRMEIMQVCGWQDESSISQVTSGKVGLKLHQLDAIIAHLGLSLVEQWYMDYLARGNTIGANCCRARASLGFCKAR